MISPVFIDEPIIVPVTIGEVLTRIARVLGALSRLQGAGFDSENASSLQNSRDALQAALESGDHVAIASTLEKAQVQLQETFDCHKDDARVCSALGFPTPEVLAQSDTVAPIDVATVLATFTTQGKQMLVSIAFERAENAKSYWLHEVRHFSADPSERVEDAILECHAPLFDRVRLAPGTRILRVKSRNLSTSTLSEEFTVEVPSP